MLYGRNQRNKHMGSVPWKIFWIILKMDIEWCWGFANIEDCIDTSLQELEERIKNEQRKTYFSSSQNIRINWKTTNTQK